MREVHDAHDAVDQAEATGDQEEHRGVEQRVQEVDGDGVHQSPTRYETTFTSGFTRLPLSASASITRYVPGFTRPPGSTISRPPWTSRAAPAATTSSPELTINQCTVSGSRVLSPAGPGVNGPRRILYERPAFSTDSTSAWISRRSPLRSTARTKARIGIANWSNEPTPSGYVKSRNTGRVAEVAVTLPTW